LERELKNFYGIKNLDNIPKVPFATRRTPTKKESIKISSAQNAWCFRAAKLASVLQVSKYTKKNFDKGCKELKKLAAYPEDVRYVPRVLAQMGIRFVVLEHLSKTKIDGAALWVKENSPVIALSLRYDRIDCFWHTLSHELSHIRHRDVYSLDTDLVGARRVSPLIKCEIEERADQEAANLLIPKVDLDSFIMRVKPLYSKQRIIQFAYRIGIHPGIIAGQLQYRGEIQYNANREMLVKIRDILIQEALTDGWGKTINVN